MQKYEALLFGVVTWPKIPLGTFIAGSLSRHHIALYLKSL